MNTVCEYRQNNTLEKRRSTFLKLSETYPERIPVIIYSKSINIKKFKFLIPKNDEHFTVGNFIHQIRKHSIDLGPEEAIYLFANNTFLSPSTKILELYEENKDEDGFLYICVEKENTFGETLESTLDCILEASMNTTERITNGVYSALGFH